VRKFLIAAVIAGSTAALGLAAVPAHAEPTDACASDPTGLGIISNPGAPGGTSGGITVCTVSQSPVQGAVTASGTAGPPPGGYIVADGNSTNQSALAGYIGVEGSSSGVYVVGCSTGDYQAGAPSEPGWTDSSGTVHNTSDHQIVGGGTSGPVVNPPGTGDACDVSP
jgi:hypothetical protein